MKVVRRTLLLFSVITLIGWTPVASAQTGFSTTNAFGDLTFSDPVAIVTPPGETNRIFVVEQGGIISMIEDLRNPTRSVFMSLTDRVIAGGERGLLGLAFHPGYTTNRYFYVFYTTQGTLFDRVSRFEINPGDPNQGMPDSELVLINQFDEASNHNGGDLHFGPEDGYLYISLGDEGAGNDTLNNSQRIDKDFFAGILRIDVDKKPGSLTPNLHPASSTNYAIPSDNPFVGATSFNGSAVNPSSVRTEFWAVGLRNPWRMSFDPGTGWLYCGDVGQNAREEIDIIVRGGNYGWNYREGLIARPGSGAPPAGFSAIDPIQDYPHGSGPTQGNSVTGGVVYRGNRIPSLFGHYVFADYVSGNVWSLYYDGTNTVPYERLLGDSSIACFGVDPRNGDVLTGDLGDDTIKRLVFAERSALLVDIVPQGSDWKYLNNGIDQGSAWREPGFNDTGWPSGPAQLGNGDGDEQTMIDLGPAASRYPTIYFRHTFNIGDPSQYLGLNLELLRDDGAVVYLNNTPVFHSNMATDPNYQTLALSTVGGADESTFFATSVDPSLLVPGANVLAVEVHQAATTSSDLSFDLVLAGEVRPDLDVVVDGNNVVVSWPAPSPGYVLQGTPSLDDSTGAPGASPAFFPLLTSMNGLPSSPWTVLPYPVVRDGNRNLVTIPPNGREFYRLAKVDPLVVTEFPQSMVVDAGDDVTLTVAATGNAPLTYAWFRNEALLPGQTGPSLFLGNIQVAEGGDYKVIVTDAVGQTAEIIATLTVLEEPVILVQPEDQTVTVGSDVTFSVTVTGTLPLSYRWRKASETLTNEYPSQEFTSSVTLHDVQLEDNGVLITVVVTNAANSVRGLISRRAILTVTE